VILPGNVEKTEIKTGSRLWDGIAQLESGAYVVTWQFRDLKSNERVSVNIGIPDNYVTLPAAETKPEPQVPPQGWTPAARPGISSPAVFGIFAVIVVGLIAMTSIANRNREDYTPPQVSMEGVGVNETLSPFEASILLRQPPEKTLTLMLFAMVKRGYIRITSEDPLRVAVQYERDLGEAERLFMEAINRETGEIDGSKLAPCFRYLATSVNEKMRPYCRKETEEFYRGVIRRTWDEVTAAETPELKLTTIDKNVLWLLQDEERMQALERELPPEEDERSARMYPDWWMMGFMMGRHVGYPYYMWPGVMYGRYSGISGGILSSDAQGQFRAISEQAFNPVVAPKRNVWGGGGRGSSGGFTPPSCACACACVSCACACACAGGGGCT